MPWDKHWEEIRFLCESLCGGNRDTLISLHPRMDIDKYRFIESDYNIPIAEEPLREILPTADSFVATFSSTVEWAVLCKIPTIVVDFYGHNYDMFDDYKGVVVVNDRHKFTDILKRIIEDNDYSEKLVRFNAEKASKLSPFDGKCMERIVKAAILMKDLN